jgi:hypothetical protein
MYSVEWENEFGETSSSEWTDDKEFLKGFYHHLVEKGHYRVMIVQKINVTDIFFDE